ncbi:MAG: RNA polymerase Rpb4 family protein [Candidatus Thermoplasmatota archaeon]|nr:RNA polymerase Rpb4 family protein [Candidatus Thermoplasmatota archaeon]
MTTENTAQLLSLAEVKNILVKVEKERKELLYEQRIALEHAQRFARLPAAKSKSLIDELKKLDGVDISQAYKIADILPETEDDVRTLFAKERVSISKETIKEILDLVVKYYVK